MHINHIKSRQLIFFIQSSSGGEKQIGRLFATCRRQIHSHILSLVKLDLAVLGDKVLPNAANVTLLEDAMEQVLQATISATVGR